MDLDPQKLLEQTALGTLWLGSWQNRRALIRALPRGGLKGASLIRQAVRIPARVSHESIAPILAYGEITEELAEATELQEGCLWMAAAPPWPQTLDETSLTWPELWNVVDQLLRALAKIHAQGIIHGDLKAELVEVLGGGARLRDVGLLFAAAREGLVEPDSSDERLAPEFRHRRWREVGPWTDLYPLGWMVRNRSKGLDVPKALDEWVDRLLNRRVVRASIALRELKEIAGEVQQSFYPDVARTGPLLDPGLGLMGRESEQKQLWEALHRVEAGEPCVVLLEGPSGSGRTALVQWLANEGEQRAIATVLRSRYGPTGAVRGGLGRLIVEHLGCMGLEGTDLETRVTTHLRSWGIAETWEIRSLLGVIDPASFPMRPGDARLRHAVVRRFLQACASQRRPGEWAQSEPTPLIVVLEDVQWGLEALSFARALLQSADLPVLLVMTLNTDEVDRKSVV